MMSVTSHKTDDPLGLGTLPELKPETGRVDEDWAAVQSALDAHDQRYKHRWMGGLAAAAVLALVVMVAGFPDPKAPGVSTQEPTLVQQGSDAKPEPGAPELIAMSQGMEKQLRFLRNEVDSMPSELLIYQVELQDLISQVDDALSLEPESEALWGQRLGLQMDLMKLYRSHLRRDHTGLASL